MDLLSRRCGCGILLKQRESCSACADRKRAELHTRGLAVHETPKPVPMPQPSVAQLVHEDEMLADAATDEILALGYELTRSQVQRDGFGRRDAYEARLDRMPGQFDWRMSQRVDVHYDAFNTAGKALQELARLCREDTEVVRKQVEREQAADTRSIEEKQDACEHAHWNEATARCRACGVSGQEIETRSIQRTCKHERFGYFYTTERTGSGDSEMRKTVEVYGCANCYLHGQKL